MWFDEKPKLVTGSFASGEPTTLAEVWDSSFETTLRSENYNAEVAEYSRAYDRRSAAIKNALNVELVNPYSSPVGSTDYIFGIEASNKADPFDFYAAELKRLQEKHPEAAGIIQADIDPRQEARGRQRGAAERAADVYERSGAFGSVASFGGALNAAAYDPLQWMTAILGPTGAARTGAVGIVEMALKQGLANAGVELAFQPKIGQWKAQGGLEHTAGDVMMNVGTAFIFGAGLDAGIRGAYRGVQSYRGMTPIVDGNGGVIGYRKAGTEDQSPPAPAAPAIADETVARAAAGEPAAIREVLEKTGELDDNPALRGALNELETVAEITARDREQFKAMGLDAGEAESAVLRNIRALTDGEPVPLREPSPVRAVEDSMSEIMGAMQRHGSKLDDVAAEVMKDAGLAADPRLKQVIDMALGGDFPELLPAIRAAVAELDAGKDAPAAAKAFTGSLADVLEKTNPEMLAAKASLLMERDPIKAARMIRGNPELVDGSIPLGNDYFDGVRALSSLSDAAFEMVARGEASPALGRVVADYVAPDLQPGILRDLIDHGVSDPEAARIMLPEFLPAPHDMVSDALMGRMLPPAERSAGLRRGADVDEPAGPAAKKQVERLRKELHAEIAEAKAKPPQMPPQPDPAMLQSAAIANAVEAAIRVAPAGTEFRTFSKVSELPDNLRVAVEKANAEVDAMFDPVSNAIYLSTAAIDPVGRLHHESVHALKAAGLLTDGEIRLLADRAAKLDNLPFDRAKYEAAYRDRYSEDGLKLALDEEAAAHLVEARSRGIDFGAEINAIADRILQFFERLRNALDGLGFRTADDVIDTILSGEVARRQAIQSVMEAEDLTAVAARPGVMFAFADDKPVTPGLDMSHEARMKRAKEMGFDTDNVLFHGTSGDDFEKFTARHQTGGMGLPGVYMTPDANYAATYAGTADGSRIMPLLVRGKIASPDEYQAIWDSVYDSTGGRFSGPALTRLVQDEMLRRGYTGKSSLYENEWPVTVVFDPRNIRSVNAAFDPANADSPNLMFAFAGERARTADLNALDLAKRMTLDGASREEVWTRTGWFRGVDGKWRFETDEPYRRPARVRPDAIGETQRSGFYFQAGRILDKVPENHFRMGGMSVINAMMQAGVKRSEIEHFGLFEKFGDNKPTTRDEMRTAIAKRMFDFRLKMAWLNPERSQLDYELGGTRAFRGPRIPGRGLYFERLMAFPKKLRGGDTFPPGFFESPHWEDKLAGTWASWRGSVREVPNWGRMLVGEEGQSDYMQGRTSGRRPKMTTKEFMSFKKDKAKYAAVMEKAADIVTKAIPSFPVTGIVGTIDQFLDLHRRLSPSHSSVEIERAAWDEAVAEARQAVKVRIEDGKQSPDFRWEAERLRALDAIVALRDANEEFFAPGAITKYTSHDNPAEGRTPETPIDETYTRTMVRDLLLLAAREGADSVAISTSETTNRIQANTHSSAAHFYNGQLKPALERELRRITGNGSLALEKITLPKSIGAPKNEKPYTVWAVKLSEANRIAILSNGQPFFALRATGEDGYNRLAGEVEARTVQKRMDLTASERRARPPWLDYDVPEDQQIVRFGGGVQRPETMVALRQDAPTRMAAPNPDDMARMIEPYIAAYPRIASMLQEQAGGVDPAEVLARVAADTDTLAEARQAISDAVGPEMAPQVEAAVLRAIMDQEIPDGVADIVQRVMDEIMPDELEPNPARAANDNPEPDPFRDSLADVERTADMQMLVEACR